MLIFYLLTIFASLPIIAYVLAQKTNNKGIIFGLTIIILTICLVVFISKFAVIGSLQKQILSNKIFEQVYIDERISPEYLNEINSILSEQELKNWLINLSGKSIDLNKLNSAESLITFSERFFNSNEEKLIFYGMYTTLRDAKFPEFKDSRLVIDSNSSTPCLIESGIINLFIMNGPEIPLAKKDFLDFTDIQVTNLDSVIPGFDLASAHLNQETIEFGIDIVCSNSNETYYLKNLIVLDKNKSFNTYKIDLNEWLKKSQEL